MGSWKLSAGDLHAAAQCNACTSAADWRAFGRFQKAEALPIVILRAFGAVEFVFDVADTEGKPIPEQLELGNLGEIPSEQTDLCLVKSYRVSSANVAGLTSESRSLMKGS